jgi:hypothetical protein
LNDVVASCATNQARQYVFQRIHPKNLPCLDVEIVEGQTHAVEKTGEPKNVLNGASFEHPTSPLRSWKALVEIAIFEVDPDNLSRHTQEAQDAIMDEIEDSFQTAS